LDCAADACGAEETGAAPSLLRSIIITELLPNPKSKI
jgi:hypothetical protein